MSERLSAAEEDILNLFRRAREDPAFHRSLATGDGVARPLKPHQVHILQAVEELMQDGTGDTMTIRLPRQWGKNEIAAQVHERHLLFEMAIGDQIVRAAPTFKPQTVNSKRRLRAIAARDPLFDQTRLQFAEGYIAHYGGEAEIHFLSSDEQARPEGATASAMLDVDEAHKTDPEVFSERFEPMTASTNAPRVLWGVAANKQDLLYQERERNFELGRGHRNIQLTARQLSEHDLVYRRHYEGRVERLGPGHPVLLTQYDMIDVDALGGAFTRQHVRSLFDSEHPRMAEPTNRAGVYIVCAIDVAGEEEEDGFDELQTIATESPDSTVMLIAEVDTTATYMDKPQIRIVEARRWTGLRLQPAPGDSDLSLQEMIMGVLGRWQPRVTVVDSRGMGQGTASWLNRVWPRRVIQYAASVPTASDDVYATYAYLNLGQLKMWRNDGSDEYTELGRELQWTRAKMSAGDAINLLKPHRSRRIDMVKALSYLPRAAGEMVTRGGVWSFDAVM